LIIVLAKSYEKLKTIQNLFSVTFTLLGVVGLSVKTCIFFVGLGQMFFLIILQNVREAVEAQAESLSFSV